MPCVFYFSEQAFHLQAMRRNVLIFGGGVEGKWEASEAWRVLMLQGRNGKRQREKERETGGCSSRSGRVTMSGERMTAVVKPCPLLSRSQRT